MEEMKTIVVRVPERLAAGIEAESRARQISKSAVVRDRLERAEERKKPPSLEAIADLIGAAEEVPPDLSARKKYYLKKMGYGRNRANR
jgi:hypothetical protein